MENEPEIADPFGALPDTGKATAYDEEWFRQYVVGHAVSQERWRPFTQNLVKWWAEIRKPITDSSRAWQRAHSLSVMWRHDCAVGFEKAVRVIEGGDGILITSGNLARVAELIEEMMVNEKKWADQTLLRRVWVICHTDLERNKLSIDQLVEQMQPATWPRKGSMQLLIDGQVDATLCTRMWRFAVKTLMYKNDTATFRFMLGQAQTRLGKEAYYEIIVAHVFLVFKNAGTPIPTWCRMVTTEGLDKTQYERLVRGVFGHGKLYNFIRKFHMIAGTFRYDHPLIVMLRDITWADMHDANYTEHWRYLSSLAICAREPAHPCFKQRWEMIARPLAMVYVLKSEGQWYERATKRLNGQYKDVVDEVWKHILSDGDPLTAWSKFCECLWKT